MLTSISASPASAGDLSPVPSPSLPWLTRFTNQVRAESRVSTSTLEAYNLDVTTLSRWAAAQRKDLVDLNTGDLTQYLNQRLEQGARPSTLARHLSSYRRFYAFLVSRGVLPANPAAAVHRPQVARDVQRLLPDAALRVLLRPSPRRHELEGSAYRAQRDHALVCMLYGTGLPISDVRLLRWKQIDEQGHVKRVTSGTGKVRSVVLDATLLAAVNALRGRLEAANLVQEENPYCFPATSGKPMTRQGLCQVVHSWARKRGLQDVVTPSGIRQAGLANRGRRRRG